MSRSCVPPPPVPPPGERARGLVRRARSAALLVGDLPDRVVPSVHHVSASGAATLQLPDAHPLVALVRARGAVGPPVMLELTDSAPVALRRPVRGLAWVTGHLRVLPARVAHRAALRIAAEVPDERLLDVGHGATLLRLDPTSVVLSDAEGAAALSPTETAAAPADPLVEVGDRWLTHLAQAHPGLLEGLARHLPPALRGPGTTVAPLAVDRLGLRLRVEGPEGDHDVRLGFEHPVACAHALGHEIRRLAGAPEETPPVAPAPRPAGRRFRRGSAAAG